MNWLQTAQEAVYFLQETNSAKADEFRQACDNKFELATLFKDDEEIATLKKTAFAPPPEPPELNGTDDVEITSS